MPYKFGMDRKQPALLPASLDAHLLARVLFRLF